MSCDDGNPLLNALVGFFSFLGDPIGTIMKGIADFVLAAAVEVFGDLITSIPTLPNTDTSKDINNQSQWIVVYLAVGSLLFAAARMAVEQRGDAGKTALKGILRVILVSGAATTVVTAAASLSDRYSDYLFQQGAQRQLDSIGQCSDGGGIQAFLLMVLAFLLLLAGIVQTVLLYIRLGVMILLLGTLPLAAAASMTDWGAGWWRKHVGWMVAWLLYKPAAGLVMYAGSVMTTYSSGDGDGSDVNVRIAGIGVMLLSAVALPALLKLVVPATAALGTGGAMPGAVSAVGGGIATGARSLGGASGGGGSAGPGGRGGPSGPSGASGTSGGGGSAGRSGMAGASGESGASGSSGASGARPAASGAGAGGGAGGGAGAAAGAGRAAAAAGGPVGAAVVVAASAAQALGRTAAGAVDGADGNHGHNT
ncbi:hypothetical protein ABZW47_07590 [Streptomyces sp. NPDC004549]|uniref:hypothetical protein n=1 Tax=Streptomyces sp. NPDC004549 TaxID=3154283 RepID=UPI00339E00D8